MSALQIIMVLFTALFVYHQVTKSKPVEEPKTYRKLLDLDGGQCFVVFDKSDENEPIKVAKMFARNSDDHEVPREIALLRQLLHPNIVRYKDTFTADSGHEVMLMEFCDAGTLNKMVYHNYSSFLDVALQLASAVDYLHSFSILHGDIKFDNVLMTKLNSEGSYQVKLADFSLAQVFNGSAVTEVQGTMGFMAPEMFSDAGYGLPVDVYALGVVLSHINNVFPLADQRWLSMNDLVNRILNDEPLLRPSASDVVTEISALQSSDPGFMMVTSERQYPMCRVVDNQSM
jgi:serine/threonine protein kinase